MDGNIKINSRTMTKLEEEMFFAIHEFGPKDGGITSDNDFDKELKRQARAAAEVCKGYIERAFEGGGGGLYWTGDEWKQNPTLEEWLLENGVIEPEKSEGITE